ncbi:MAG: DNA mismatch repair protein MutT [Omnitrophica bacterium GWA2_52_8]|nr:MAG: DNA mismatch repair protein MutT [Omnitrophica bacterium GWA2_52_8]
MILATLAYLKKDGKTLMMHRIKKDRDVHQGKWNGLGGKMHAGETPEECVIREIREEAGLEAINPKLRGVLTFPDFDGKQDWYAFLYTVTEFSGRLSKDCPEGHLEWIDDAKLQSLPLWEGDYQFLKWLEDGKNFSAKFVYVNKKLTDSKVVFW